MAKVPRFQQQRHHRHSNLEQPAATWSEGELYERLPEIEEPFLLILDCVQDPHNLGACLRSADAVGVHAVIIPKDKSAGITDVVRRVACGGAENTPVVQVTNLARCLGKLKELGVWLVGTADDGSDTLYTADLTGPIGVVMGAEGSGIRRLTRENCDFLIQIPMAKTRKVDCLNVSVATGVVLFEARRQRLQKSASSSSMTPTHG